MRIINIYIKKRKEKKKKKHTEYKHFDLTTLKVNNNAWNNDTNSPGLIFSLVINCSKGSLNLKGNHELL